MLTRRRVSPRRRRTTPSTPAKGPLRTRTFLPVWSRLSTVKRGVGLNQMLDLAEIDDQPLTVIYRQDSQDSVGGQSQRSLLFRTEGK